MAISSSGTSTGQKSLRSNTTDLRVDVIRRAIAEVRKRGLLVTDDTAACELIGQPVKLVLSTQPNRSHSARRLALH